MLDTPGEADGSDGESTRGLQPPSDFPSGPEYVPHFNEPAEADGSDEGPTRGLQPPGGSSSDPECIPSLNGPSEAEEHKGEPLRGLQPPEGFALRRLAWPFCFFDTHFEGVGGMAAQPDAAEPPHTTQPFGSTSMRSAHASTDT